MPFLHSVLASPENSLYASLQTVDTAAIKVVERNICALRGFSEDDKPAAKSGCVLLRLACAFFLSQQSVTHCHAIRRLTLHGSAAQA